VHGLLLSQAAPVSFGAGFRQEISWLDLPAPWTTEDAEMGKTPLMKEKLDRDQLLALLDKVMQPTKHGLTEQEGDEALLLFCAGCPDPVGARRLVVECLDPMTDEEILDRALGMPLRRMVDVPAAELPLGHPLRRMAP
jgi:hypothetical protein